MAKKIDLSGMKEFFFNHGEKVALGACAFIGLVLGLWGLWDASSAGRPDGSSKSFQQEFVDKTQKIRDAIKDAPVPTLASVDVTKYVWDDVKPKHKPTPYVAIAENDDAKRRNPPVLPIRAEPNAIKLDHVRGLTFAYKYGINNRGEKVVTGLVDLNGAAPPPPMPPPKKGSKAPLEPVVIPPFMQVGKSTNMVVVHAVFPMKQQVDEFRKALKMIDQRDLFNKDRDDLPRPLGIDVIRYEVINGQPAKDPVVLMLFDPTRDNGHLQMNAKLETMLREAIYDERSPETLEDYIWAGLMTPMPKLANRSYPRFEFPGFDVDFANVDDPEKRAGMVAGVGPQGQGPMRKDGPLGGFGKGKFPFKDRPMPMADPGKKENERKPQDILASNLNKVVPELVNRLFLINKRIDEDLNPYHVLGLKPDDAAKPANILPGGQQPMNQPKSTRYFTAWDRSPPEAGKDAAAVAQPEKGGKLGVPPVAAFPAWDRDALVRFIDVDVVPGKEYFYSIRVRMANPNFVNPGEKKKEVAFDALAREKELIPSAWVNTPRIKIPMEYYLYAIDQPLIDDWAEGRGEIKKGPGAKTYSPSKENNETTLQIHQFCEKKGDLRGAVEPYVIGDWAVAERQVVRKGDYIGKDINVQVPVWNERKDTFEFPHSPRDKKEKFAPKGIHINLTGPDGKAPVLVDFTGGKKLNKLNALEEEIAVDALILMPDGQLRVLNSRDAADGAASEDAKERQDRVITARHVRGAGPPLVNPKGPFIPGSK